MLKWDLFGINLGKVGDFFGLGKTGISTWLFGITNWYF
jgi:hypothetical protein